MDGTHKSGAAWYVRRWVILALLAVVGAGVAVYFIARPPRPPVLMEAGQVRSSVAQAGDSLQVIVQWQLTDDPAAGRAESLRVEVRVDIDGATASRVRLLSGLRRDDTVYVPAPLPGATAEGLSCVAAQHRAMISQEHCTPWRYVRPLAAVSETAGQAAAANRPTRIVVQPSGLQVDPDIGGRCADWQRRHPAASVWIEVNRLAVPACTGPNNRPTVAQFCAFAVLPNGRRVKTTNSTNIPYCDELFRAWERQRLS